MTGGLSLSLTVGLITFLLSAIWGGPFVEILRRLRIGKQIQVELSDEHQKKVGTPTMGGLMIVWPVVLIMVILNIAQVVRTGSGASTFLPLIVLVGFSILGLIDDWEGIRRSRGPRGTGISPRTKLVGQLLLSGFAAGMISLYGGGFSFANEVYLPILGVSIAVHPIFFIPLTMFIIIATSNAVNLTDGLDGLAGIISASAFAAYGVIALLQGQTFLVQLCFILVGACFAFLWYNAHPAQLFMGDTGSLALGGTLGMVAVMTGQWLLLPIIAIVPVAETISVILQVLSARYTRKNWGVDKRIFRQAPIHLHFQLGGWSETQTVQRFWLVGILAAMVGIALAVL